MAGEPTRTRPCADEPSRADADPSAEKTKTQSEIELEAWESWVYPPEFWDGLSEISLSRKALREFDRRSRLCCSPPFPPAPSQGLVPSESGELARFARHGGPDLRNLRGYPPPLVDHDQRSVTMSFAHSPRSKIAKSANAPETATTSKTPKTKKSTTYNRDFELHLTEHLVHSINFSEEADLGDVTAALAVPRPSLSPLRFTDADFKAFRANDERAKDGDDVLANVIPTVLGPSQPSRHCARNTLFTKLEPLTDGSIAASKPDIYYGAYPQQLHPTARNELAGHIVPSTMEDKPMAPNFFLQVKGPGGEPAVLKRQARYDGAIGSRAIHSLQNYGKEEPEYDGNPYTFSSTYLDGTLKLYIHRVTAPVDGGRPEYHTMLVNTWGLTGNINSFRGGVAAFRNARDLAQQHRDSFIQAANARVAPERGIPLGRDAAVTQQGSSGESAFCAPDDLDEEYKGKMTTAPASDPSASFTTGFATIDMTSSSHPTRSKRQRNPRAPVQAGEAARSRKRHKTEKDTL